MANVNDLMGKLVVGLKAFALGSVNDVEVDTGTWQVTHLHVNLTSEATREFGFKKPILGAVKVLVPVSLIQAAGDMITLNKDREELKSLIEPHS